jgi:hypothetical protein
MRWLRHAPAPPPTRVARPARPTGCWPSHTRALSDVRAAEHAVRSASDESTATRSRYTAARAKAEALRRVADLRVSEIIQAREATERRELDELAILGYARRNAA